MLTLRAYQTTGIAEIRQAFGSGFKSLLYVLPTGGGKTVLFSAIAESSEKRNKRVLILVHRVELVDQVMTALADFNVYPDVIAASYSRRSGGRHTTKGEHHSVCVASVQTLIRRLDTYAEPDLIICDEAHHCVAGNSWSTIMQTYRNSKRLGTTATPIRLDGRGLGASFDHLIVGPSVRELTDQGYLAPARIFAPPTVDTSGLHVRGGDYKPEETEALMDVPTITGDALSHYKQHAPGFPALVFCTSVAHAHHVADQFRRDGISAFALDGGTDKEVRHMAVKDFREGRIRVLASCDLFSEGFDVPGIHAGILLRPTASETLFRQQIGRCLRPAPGKTHALILDHANNTMKFGLPDAPREWMLTADKERKPKKPILGIRVCEKCFAASPPRALVCVECGHVFEVKPRQEVAYKDGQLIELTPEMIAKKIAKRERGASRSLDQLRQYGKKMGYKPGWAERIHAARERKQRSRSA